MRGIAAEAGLTAMALYNYAPSKAALFEAVWQESIGAIYTDYEAVVAGRASLVQELEALLDRSRDLLVDNPDHVLFVVRMLVERQHAGLADANLQVPTATDFLTQLAERGVRRGEIAKRDREQLVTFISTLLWGITTITAFDPDALDSAVEAAKWAARRHLDPAKLGT
jgi:AcrR family transcriptional regulator